MTNTKRPLEDILIIDNSWIVAGPHGVRLLSDLGAKVIHVESSKKKDMVRFDHIRLGVKDPKKEGGWVFQDNNRNAMGLQLNMKSAKGREIYYKLVQAADVVVSNITPRAVKSMGIDFETLSQYNPKIISVNASGMGDYGCKKDTMVFAPALNCLTGCTYTVGYEGEEGVGISVSTADDVGGAMLAFSVLQAIAQRDATGKGQFIDLSEAENMLSFIGSTILEWAYNKEQTGPIGNHAYYGPLCPHNAYSGAGRDNWMVIAIGSDEEWQRFVAEVGDEAPALKDEKFVSYEGRKANEKELDDIIAGIAVKHNNRVFAERLQNAGVSAAPVNPASETLADEHLNARGFWNLVGLPETDPRQPDFLVSADVPKSMPRSEKTFKPGPAMGQDNEWILKEFLHLTDEEIEEAKNDDAFI